MALTRDVFKHASIYGFASVLGKAVGFLMLPFYASIFLTKGYGVVGMMDAAINLLLSLFGYGIGGGLVRFYHEEAGSKGRVISTGLWVLWGGGLAVAAVLIVFSRPLSLLLFGDRGYALFLSMALASFLLDLTGQAASTLLLVRQRSVVFSTVSLLRLATGLGLNILLIIVLDWGLLGYFVSSVATAGLTSAILHAYVIRECGVVFDASVARKLLRFELPLVPGNLISFVSRQIERVLIRFQIGLEGVGVLEMAYKFPPLLSMLITEPFMQSWNTKRTEIAEQPGAGEAIGRMLTRFLFVAVFFGLLLGVNMHLLLEILTPHQFWKAANIARIEIVTTLLMGCYFHLVFGLYYTKQTRAISTIKVVTALAKIGLSYPMIRAWGLGGAAYSALAAAVLQVSWTTIKSQRAFPIHIEYRRIAVVVGAAAVLGTLIVCADLGHSSTAAAVRSRVVPQVMRMLQESPLGVKRTCVLAAALDTKAEACFALLVNLPLTCLYFALFPVVRGGSGSR
jgi:O-antigen/teichoic acid export membrane protein